MTGQKPNPTHPLLTARGLRRAAALAGATLVLGATLATASASTPASNPTPTQLCAGKLSTERCNPGLGQRPPQCATCVDHSAWPSVTGVRWWVIENSRAGHRLVGGSGNDELLGRHGSDTIVGQGGDDVLWGDDHHEHNNATQRDRLSGGAGDDWIYASHGYNRITAGPGDDRVLAYFGHGVIDCGPGRDTVTIPHHGHQFRLKHCEIIKHPGN